VIVISHKVATGLDLVIRHQERSRKTRKVLSGCGNFVSKCAYVKTRFPLLFVALALLTDTVAAQAAPRVNSRRLKTAFTRQPGWIYDQDASRPVRLPDFQPKVIYYRNGAFRPMIEPEPPLREVQIDDLAVPSPTPIPTPLASATPLASPTASIEPSRSPSATPSIAPSPTPVPTSSPSPTPIPAPSPTVIIVSPTPAPSPSVPMPTPSAPPGVTPTPAPSVPPPPPPPVVPPLPRPTISPVATAPPAQKATVSFADRSSVQSRAAAGKFQLVALHPSESVNIALRVSAASGAAMSVRVLDGGAVVGPSTVSVANGKASVGFQAGSQPGLYRVLVEGSGTKALFQFWVSSAADAAPRPPVLNPAH